MDDVRRAVATLFGEDYVSLDILDEPGTEENIVSLAILDKPLRREKCKHLSPGMNCNVGGFSHAGCLDESFHSHCKFKLLYEKKRVPG